MTTTAANKVRTQSDQIARLAKSWPMVAALMGGTSEMREAGKTFLPQWPNEDDDVYATRLATSVLHPVFRRTILVNAARPFAKPATIDTSLPDEWIEDVDLQGTSVTQFANSLLVDALGYGIAGVLVESPKAAGVKTVAEEKAANVRPYFVKYAPQAILGWKLGEAVKLMQMRLLEMVDVDDGEFGTKSIEQVRVLEPGKWTIYRQDAKKDWQVFDQGVTTLTEVPFVFFYGLRTGFGTGQSPLLDLAYQNVEHYQSSSDQQTITHVARVPILVAIGFGEADITIGASQAVSTDTEGASLTYVEHTGAAIGSGRVSILDLEERMRSTGAELISPGKGVATATQITAEGEASKSTLQQIIEVFEESLEAALGIMAKWVNKDDTVNVELFKAFDIQPDTDAAELAAAVDRGVISKRTHFEELQRRDVLSNDLNWEDEQTRIAAEPKDDPVKTDAKKVTE